MQIITTATIKGGTGKTTTAASLAQAATEDGKKVLCIDLDPQADLSFAIGGDQNKPGSYDLLHGEDARELIQDTPQGIDIITGAPDLATEQTKNASARRLQDAIEPIKRKYDFIFIDTPPQMGELTFNALQASTGLIVPLETDNFSLQGLYQVLDLARAFRKSNGALKNQGAVISRYDARPNINRFFYDAIKKAAAEQGAPLLMAIKPGIAVKEAQAFQRSLFEYAPKSKPAQDYKALYEHIKGKKWEPMQ